MFKEMWVVLSCPISYLFIIVCILLGSVRIYFLIFGFIDFNLLLVFRFDVKIVINNFSEMRIFQWKNVMPTGIQTLVSISSSSILNYTMVTETMKITSFYDHILFYWKKNRLYDILVRFTYGYKIYLLLLCSGRWIRV